MFKKIISENNIFEKSQTDEINVHFTKLISKKPKSPSLPRSPFHYGTDRQSTADNYETRKKYGAELEKFEKDIRIYRIKLENFYAIISQIRLLVPRKPFYYGTDRQSLADSYQERARADKESKEYASLQQELKYQKSIKSQDFAELKRIEKTFKIMKRNYEDPLGKNQSFLENFLYTATDILKQLIP